jgi:hypothetical protein
LTFLFGGPLLSIRGSPRREEASNGDA